MKPEVDFCFLPRPATPKVFQILLKRNFGVLLNSCFPHVFEYMQDSHIFVYS